MTIIEELRRRILLKRQLVEWTQGDIRELEKKVKELEVVVVTHFGF
jgi:hypothetical protein